MIELVDLRFRWTPGGADILDIPTLTVAEAERVFLRGPSGSGKTTLLNLLGGVTVPQAGRITVAGTELSALPGAARDRFRADRVGFIFQLFNLVPYLGLVENVTLPCRFSPARREAVAARGGAEAEARRLLAHMELDVDTLAGRPVANLSVGQQQRVAAARALIGAPDLVIADEPTSSIDTGARDAFLSLLFGEVEATGATLLFVSHDPGLERHFTRTVELACVNRAVAPAAA